MFCSKCGSQIPDGFKFCSKCGNPVATNVAPQVPVQQPSAPVQEAPVQDVTVQPAPQAPQYAEPQYAQPQYAEPQYAQPQYAEPQYAQPQYAQPQYAQPQYAQPQYAQPQYGQPAPKKPVNKKLIGIIAGVAAAVILVVVLIIVLSGGGSGASSYKDAALGFANATFKDFSIKKAFSYVPDAIIENELKEEGMTRKEFIETYQEDMDYMKESMNEELGKNWSVSNKITDSEKYDKDEISDLNDDLKEEYGKKIGKVTEAYEVEIEMTITYREDGEKMEETDTLEVLVGKIGGKWYVLEGMF